MAKPPQELEKQIQDTPKSEPSAPTQAKLVSRLISSHQEWSAPLPPPAALEQYDKIVPGGADRILQMAERAQAHRMECERIALECGRLEIGPSLKMGSRGQWLGWTLAVIAIVGAAACGIWGAPWQVSVALVGVPVLGAVQAIVEGRRQQQLQHEQPEEED